MPPPRALGLRTATLLVVATMIGTGVFTTAGMSLAAVPSGPALLVSWLVGGVTALCGALCYAELGAALPRNGGDYHLLSRILHPAVGFLAGWVSLVVGFSAAVAASAHAFGDYLSTVLPRVSPTLSGAALIAAFSAVHATSTGGGARIQDGFTAAKVAVIAAFVVAGLVLGAPQRLGHADIPLRAAIGSGPFAVSLVFVAYAYSGWNGAVYIAGEVARPAYTLPRALVLGTGLVTLLYLGLNAAFLAAAPLSDLAGHVEVGFVAGQGLFGDHGAQWVAGLIALGLVSNVSAMIMAGPRVYETMGEDHPRLRWLAGRRGRGGPVPAIALQGLLSVVMLLSAGFDAIVTYIGLTLTLSATLVVGSSLVLRRREPHLPRPFRIPAYPIPPILFLLLAAWMTLHTILSRPIVALWSGGTLLSGLGMWAGVRERKPRS